MKVSTMRAAALAVVLAARLDGCSDEPMRPSPWHMWGDEKSFTLDNVHTLTQTSQIARVSYKRPETWSFLAWARITGVQQLPGQAVVTATDVALFVAFTFSLGLGRTVVQLEGAPDGVLGPFNMKPGMVNFKFPIGAVAGAFCMTNSSQAQGQVATDFSTGIAPLLEHFPADDIQVQATVAGLIVHPYQVQLTAGCILAPRNHIRPEWFLQEFPGEEHKGV